MNCPHIVRPKLYSGRGKIMETKIITCQNISKEREGYIKGAGDFGDFRTMLKHSSDENMSLHSSQYLLNRGTSREP